MANCLGWREKGVDLLGFMAVVQNITLILGCYHDLTRVI